ncbi:hypothetical protein BT63DRAFT_464131 [Microthyrium microscopicum]|uniref:NAD(P)-binding protein n=1 Tax=Microthyrium microscopicum TaxID=703497 RepID=A0A6A6U1Q0_9PEZI|nr:hypothetical protein BT63DRAFT_464131 [Microthyrium microscopicum]
MVQLEIVTASNAALFSRPITAVFVGGATGIGHLAVRAFAAAHGTTGQGLNLYLVGRNEVAANEIINDCQKVCPAAEFTFIPGGDLTLLASVSKLCTTIIETITKDSNGAKPHIDLLVMTQGTLYFDGRRETSEGLDQLMTLLYYSRMLLTTNLAPLLTSGPAPGHVVSVYAPNRDTMGGATFKTADISLRDPKNYGFGAMGAHVAYMTTFFFERLAADHAGRLSLCHYFPGLVEGPGFDNEGIPKWVRVAAKVVLPLVRRWACVPNGESGQRVVFHATDTMFPASGANAATKKKSGVYEELKIAKASDGVVGGGAYRCNWNNEIIETPKSYVKLRADGVADKVWEHTNQVFKDIAQKGKTEV